MAQSSHPPALPHPFSLVRLLGLALLPAAAAALLSSMVVDGIRTEPSVRTEIPARVAPSLMWTQHPRVIHVDRCMRHRPRYVRVMVYVRVEPGE